MITIKTYVFDEKDKTAWKDFKEIKEWVRENKAEIIKAKNKLFVYHKNHLYIYSRKKAK